MNPSTGTPSRGANDRSNGCWWLVFVVGLALSLVMVFRSQVEGDTLNMLARGWRFAFAGEWLQYGLPTSAGGKSPGGFLSLLVGLPLVAWADFRAPALLLWLLSVIGYVVLDGIVGRVLGPRGRLLFALYYWINPWRIHFTSFLWNPNYMFFLGALHAWAAYRLRRESEFWPSAVLVLIVGIGVQLHTSIMVLVLASLLLWWRGFVRINWWGVVAGGLVTAASLLPWFFTVATRSELFPGGTGFPFRNLLLVQPALRGVLYLLRYPSLALPRQVYDLDLAPGTVADDSISYGLAVVLVVLGWVTVLVSCAAYRRFLRRPLFFWRRRPTSMPDRAWLRGYVFWCLAGAVVAFAISPTTVMFWQGLPVFHVAALVIVLFLRAQSRSRRAPAVRRLLFTYALVSLVVVCLLCFSSPMFRRSSPPPRPLTAEHVPDSDPRIVADHPMYRDLGIVDRCGLVLVDEGGWWPDVFAPPPLIEDDVVESISRPPG